MTTESQEPVTIAGKAISDAIDRPVPPDAGGDYVVRVTPDGAVTVWYPDSGHIRLSGDSASAKNVRGLLLALRAGSIA